MIFFGITGHGVFTLKIFRKGDFLLEYVGERLETDDAVSAERSCFLYGFRYNGKKIWYI
jgi:SET domain-containing protein